MKHYIGAMLLLLTLLFTGCIKDINPSGMTIVIPASRLTQSLQRQFPVTQNTDYGKVTLKNPKALLQKGSDRITAGATVLFSNSLIPQQQGSVYVSGKPYFDAKTGSIYLNDPNIEKLDINGYKLGNFLNGSVANQLKPLINEVFRQIPIYKMDRNSIQGSFVKNVRVEDGNLLVTFGL
ncbi:MAG: hypothetical protein DSZ05_02155 [Sulfurospirillum sp.]|nr:MAG: hypothetical protein DSZ05_02155 [Sulfurospirillum sp.]